MSGKTLTEVKLQLFPYLLHPQPVALIVSKGAGGKVNGMTASWLIPVSWNPPLVCVAISPARYTFQLIRESRDFTVNILDADMVEESELFGRFSGRERDKFSESRLTLRESASVKSPHIAESLAALECVLHDKVRAGDHFLVIGRVEKVYARRGVLEDNTYNPAKAKILLYLGGKRYTTTSDEILQPR